MAIVTKITKNDINQFLQFYDIGSIVSYKEIIQGRIQLLKIHISDMDIVLINIYGPNKNDANFYSILEDLIKQYDSETLIIGGDYNTIIDNNKDKQNGRTDTNKNNNLKINSFISNYDLNDVWRIFNPELNRFT